MHTSTRRSERGATLVELMAVLAILSILGGLAGVAFRGRSQAQGADAFGYQVGALVAEARLRATSAQRWQCLEVLSDRIVHHEAPAAGLAAPSMPLAAPAWSEVGVLSALEGVRIASTDAAVHTDIGSAPAPGSNLPAELCFSPDGSLARPGGALEPMTVFIEDDAAIRSRVLIYGATASETVLSGW